jgi:T5SS/PEP-CTERM-associated repeat protein
MHWSRRIAEILLMLALPVLVAPAISFAQPVIWAGGNGPWFSASSNWFVIVGGFPVATAPPNGPGVTANIGTYSGAGPITGTVTLNGSVNLPDGVALGNGAPGGLIVNSAAYTLTAGTMDVGFSGSGTSTLAISNRGVVTSNFAFIGGLAGSSGSVSVSGAGSQWNVPTQLYVGDNGQGSLSIQSGGLVSGYTTSIASASGSAGAVTVSGAGSQLNSTEFVAIGWRGYGTLTVQSGGVSNADATEIAALSGAVGNVTVTGAGSQLNSTTETLVGPTGHGTLTIQNGGVVNGGFWTLMGIGSGAVGNVTVMGAGSQLNSGEFSVGSGSQGTLTIQNGGAGNCNILIVASSSGAFGTVAVTGAGSELNASDGGVAEVGYGGQGRLTIADGGRVTDASATVGALLGSVGNVLVDAGTWTSSGALDIGIVGTGVVTVADNGHLSAGSMTIGSHGSLIVDPAVVDVLGDFTLSPGGTLQLDIGGITPGLFSQLDISGFGLFQGTIDFDFIDGFAPTTGESFDLIHAVGVDFSDTRFQIEGLEPGFQYTTAFSNGSFTLVAENDGVSTPEPGSWWLLASALSILSVIAWRKNSKGPA